MDRGLEHVQTEQESIREYVKDIKKVAVTLRPGGKSCKNRQKKFKKLIGRLDQKKDLIYRHMVTLMISLLASLFVRRGKVEGD